MKKLGKWIKEKQLAYLQPPGKPNNSEMKRGMIAQQKKTNDSERGHSAWW
jgi:hypothetical protein